MIISNPNDTIKFAADLAKTLKKQDIILLKGDLGVGKTFLAQAIIRCLANDQTLVVTSPSFSILQIYNLISLKIYHFDLYRLKSTDEILELGIEEGLEEGICIIEWPQIIEYIFNDLSYISINITITETGDRLYELS